MIIGRGGSWGGGGYCHENWEGWCVSCRDLFVCEWGESGCRGVQGERGDEESLDECVQCMRASNLSVSCGCKFLKQLV